MRVKSKVNYTSSKVYGTIFGCEVVCGTAGDRAL